MIVKGPYSPNERFWYIGPPCGEFAPDQPVRVTQHEKITIREGDTYWSRMPRIRSGDRLRAWAIPEKNTFLSDARGFLCEIDYLSRVRVGDIARYVGPSDVNLKPDVEYKVVGFRNEATGFGNTNRGFWVIRPRVRDVKDTSVVRAKVQDPKDQLGTLYTVEIDYLNLFSVVSQETTQQPTQTPGDWVRRIDVCLK